jgi:hypothetical protein
MLIITQGSSAADKKEIPSCFKLIPGLEDDVMALTPTAEAP